MSKKGLGLIIIIVGVMLLSPILLQGNSHNNIIIDQLPKTSGTR